MKKRKPKKYPKKRRSFLHHIPLFPFTASKLSPFPQITTMSHPITSSASTIFLLHLWSKPITLPIIFFPRQDSRYPSYQQIRTVEKLEFWVESHPNEWEKKKKKKLGFSRIRVLTRSERRDRERWNSANLLHTAGLQLLLPSRVSASKLRFFFLWSSIFAALVSFSSEGFFFPRCNCRLKSRLLLEKVELGWSRLWFGCLRV